MSTSSWIEPSTSVSINCFKTYHILSDVTTPFLLQSPMHPPPLARKCSLGMNRIVHPEFNWPTHHPIEAASI